MKLSRVKEGESYGASSGRPLSYRHWSQGDAHSRVVMFTFICTKSYIEINYNSVSDMYCACRKRIDYASSLAPPKYRCHNARCSMCIVEVVKNCRPDKNRRPNPFLHVRKTPQRTRSIESHIPTILTVSKIPTSPPSLVSVTSSNPRTAPAPSTPLPAPPAQSLSPPPPPSPPHSPPISARSPPASPSAAPAPPQSACYSTGPRTPSRSAAGRSSNSSPRAARSP